VKQFDARFFDEFFSFARCLVLGTPADFVNHFRRFHTYLLARPVAATKLVLVYP
jgi:hypothetical protein